MGKGQQRFMVALTLAMSLTITACSDFQATPSEKEFFIRSLSPSAPPIWSPNGDKILFNADWRMHIVDADGSGLFTFPQAVFPLVGRYFESRYSLEYAGSISSDGLALFQHFEYGEWPQLETVMLDGSGRRRIDSNTPGRLGARMSTPAKWSPSGSRIAYVQDELLRIVDRDGNIDGSYMHPQINLSHFWSRAIVWSTDGQKIAMNIADDSPRNGGCELYNVRTAIIDLYQGMEPVILPYTVSHPAWSPDGSRLAFADNLDGITSIFTIRPDGRELEMVVSFAEDMAAKCPLREATSRGSMSWSPDGSELRLHRSPLVTVKTDGSSLRIMQLERKAEAAWSPDDSRVAVLLDDSPTGVRLFTMKPDGSDKRVLVRWDEATNNRWEAVRNRPNLDGRFEWTEVDHEQ